MNNGVFMKKQNVTNCLLALFMAGFTVPVFAHTGAGVTYSFMAGLIHPWLGADHVLVMFAIGLWGCLQGGKQLWLLPLTFLLWMTTGAALGFANICLLYPEIWVASSVVLCGLLIGMNRKTKPILAMALASLFALGHGYVHAAEIAKNTDQTEYALGLLLTTATLHSLGIMFGLFGANRLQTIRINFGLVCAAVGVLLLAG
jgi:urease accessory protein